MVSKTPVIGINGELSVEPEAVVLPVRYARAIRKAGGLPVIVPPLREASFLRSFLDSIDGLVLAGGDDFRTEPLGLGPTHSEAKPVPVEKQAFDVELVRAALARGLPTLGICYGMQLMALSEGADLHQHLPEDRPGAQEHRGGVRHAVRVCAGTKLAACLGVAETDVISRHHQALATIGPEWVLAAEDHEGGIEAIERKEHPFALGVQWHPELSEDDPVQERLFGALIGAATGHRSERRLALGARQP